MKIRELKKVISDMEYEHHSSADWEDIIFNVCNSSDSKERMEYRADLHKFIIYINADKKL